MFGNPGGFVTAQYTEAVLGKTADAAVGLVIPVGETGALCKVLGNVDKTTARTAGIRFLNAYQVILAHQLGDTV